jgi:hypothetical protein
MADLTCFHCGSTSFVLVIVDRKHRIDTRPANTWLKVTTTEIRCVNHDGHVAEDSADG